MQTHFHSQNGTWTQNINVGAVVTLIGLLPFLGQQDQERIWAEIMITKPGMRAEFGCGVLGNVQAKDGAVGGRWSQYINYENGGKNWFRWQWKIVKIIQIKL
jgi:hypothetical protein